MKATSKAVFALYYFLTLSLFSFAQGPSFNYARQIGSTGNDSGQSIICDSVGNTYITGYFSGTTDFDPSINTYTLTSFGLTDCFVCKFDPSGNFIWAKQIGGTQDDRTNAISIDSYGNLFIVGTFIGTCDFDPSPSVYTISCFGGTQEDGFILKLSNSGNFIWAKQIGGTSPDFIKSIVTDPMGNSYSTGHHSGVCDFNPSGTSYTLACWITQCFILKLDSGGNFNWVKHFFSTYKSEGKDIERDKNGNLITTGNFVGNADFDPSPSIYFLYTNSLVSTYNGDIFVSKLDSSGNFLWAKSFSGTGDDYGMSVTTDNLGNVYSTGFFADVVDFDPGTGTYSLSANTSIRNIYVSKLNSSGNFEWAKRIGGTFTDDRAYSICLDEMNNAYIAGSFNGYQVNFDIGISNYTLSSSASDNDIFISKYDQYGNFIWVKAMQGTMDDKAFSICLDPIGNIFTTGSFNNTIDFNPDAGVYYLSNPSLSGIPDIFICKLSCQSPTIIPTASSPTVCLGKSTILSASGAATYTWSNGVSNNGSATPTSNITYSVIGTGTNGCQSASPATIAILVNSIPNIAPNASSQDVCIGNTVVVYGSGAHTYTWIASNGSTVLNNVPFTPTITATYSVNGTNTITGCEGNLTWTGIYVHSLPTVSAVSNPTLICSGETATLSADGALTYKWNTNQTNTTITVSPTLTTSYTVTGKDYYGCSNSFTITQLVSLCEGLIDFTNNIISELLVFPNPNNGIFTISTSSSAELELLNTLGQRIQLLKLDEENNHQVNLTSLSEGIYFLKEINKPFVGGNKIIVHN